MEEAQAMLDQLMGKDRNLPDSARRDLNAAINFEDKRICKNYICGACPQSLFAWTKSEFGQCPYEICANAEADTIKVVWEKLPQSEKDKFGYEYDLMQSLQVSVAKNDAKIFRKKREAEQRSIVSDDDLKKIADLQKEILDCTELCEKLSEEGNIDKAQEVMIKIEKLKSHEELLTNRSDKKLFVCEVTGNFMSGKDTNERLKAHYEGRQYLGWKKIRDRLDQLHRQNPPPLVPPVYIPNPSYTSRSRLFSSAIQSQSQSNSGDHHPHPQSHRQQGRGGLSQASFYSAYSSSHKSHNRKRNRSPSPESDSSSTSSSSSRSSSRSYSSSSSSSSSSRERERSPPRYDDYRKDK